MYSQSVTASSAFTYDRHMIVSTGASGAVTTSLEDEPMCMLTTVSVSWQAAKSGSQAPV